MQKRYLFFFFITLFAQISLAQEYILQGHITDAVQHGIPFASVQVQGSSIGTAANVDGAYTLKLKKGKYTLEFRAVGYQPRSLQVELNGSSTQNIVLQGEVLNLDEVVIRKSAEDPAYAIIRQAIKARKAHLNAVDEYSTHVYIKGVQKLVGAPKKFFGRDIQKTLDLDTNRKGVIYLSESESLFQFKRPNKIHEEMLSSKVAGQNNAFSFNKASDLIINFYQNILLENTLSARGFVSPIADQALMYYKYLYLGTQDVPGASVHKIQVIPRRPADPVFRGIIYIIEEDWGLYETDLYLTQAAGINFIDTLQINQQFSAITPKIYMPTSTNLQFNGDVLGFKFQGYYISIYSQYNLKPNFEKNHFKGEILKITELANKKEAQYWLDNRPIPLNNEEMLNYVKKDSIEKLQSSKHYLDSIERDKNKFGIGKMLITPYTYNDRYNKQSYTFDPLYNAIMYNTVEGLALNYGVRYRKTLDQYKSYTIRPEMRYGFASKTFSANINAQYNYSPGERAYIGTRFGNGMYDLNNYGSLPPYGNTINSLLYEKNFTKLYQKSFFHLYTGKELTTGLQARLDLKFDRNSPMVNHSSFKIRDVKDLEFSSNNPFNPGEDLPLFEKYNSLLLSASLTYTFDQKYITRPEGKFYQGSKLPILNLNYTKALPKVLNSQSDFDLLTLSLRQNRISQGLWGYTSFILEGGYFLNNKQIQYPDYKHFQGNISLIFPPDLRKFQYLDFYLFSTKKRYLEAHIEHNFSGFLFNKIPGLRALKINEFAGFNYLTTPDKVDYYEFYFGIERYIFRLSYGFAYGGKTKLAQGFRLSYGF